MDDGTFAVDPLVQRDRFVAFSFAATDLVLEVDTSGAITFASGACLELTGHEASRLVGSSWLELFVDHDRIKLARTLARLPSPGRVAPVAARLAGHGGGAPLSVVFSACRLPHRGKFTYCTISAASMALVLTGQDETRDQVSGLLDADGFTQLAEATLEAAQGLGKSLELTLIELGGAPRAEALADPERRSAFMSNLGATLRERSVGGDMAARLSEDRFGLIHDAGLDAAEIERDIRELSRSFAADGKELEVGSSTVDLQADGLSPAEAGQALVYTINSFAEANDGEVTIHSLTAGFKQLAVRTRTRIGRLKSILSSDSFEFQLQPVVDLQTATPQYYELLLRLKQGESPYPWIVFAEGVGMIQDLDMAVLQRAAAFLRDPATKATACVAVNLSGRSLSTPQFMDRLLAFLNDNQELSWRLLIEITESSRIVDLAHANKAITALRTKGFRVGLDDFGSGASSFQYLRGLDVEFLKFDGDYVRQVLESPRESLMVKAVAALCRDLQIKTVGEMIEQSEQAEHLRRLGVDLGQGYHFGRPASPGELGLCAGPARAAGTAKAGFVRPRFNPYTGARVSRG